MLAPLAALAPGDSIVAVNGVAVHQWGEVMDGIMNGTADTVTIAVAGKPEVLLPVHPDAVEERALAAQAIGSLAPADHRHGDPRRPGQPRRPQAAATDPHGGRRRRSRSGGT